MAAKIGPFWWCWDELRTSVVTSSGKLPRRHQPTFQDCPVIRHVAASHLLVPFSAFSLLQITALLITA